MSEVYEGREWGALLNELTPRQVRNAIKGGLRRVAKGAAEIGRESLRGSGLMVKGDGGDWEKGVRPYVYSRGGGFLVTVKARASRSGKDKGMHVNRVGARKPVLMWAEGGTRERRSKVARRRATFFERARTGKRVVRMNNGVSRGRMPAYGFLAAAEGRMFAYAEQALAPDMDKAVEKAARKAGLL